MRALVVVDQGKNVAQFIEHDFCVVFNNYEDLAERLRFAIKAMEDEGCAFENLPSAPQEYQDIWNGSGEPPYKIQFNGAEFVEVKHKQVA